jgi:hypothetical protein
MIIAKGGVNGFIKMNFNQLEFNTEVSGERRPSRSTRFGDFWSIVPI